MKFNTNTCVLGFLLLFSMGAFSDEPPDIEIGYLCDKSKDRLELRLFYIEDGVEILQKDKEGNKNFERIRGGRVHYEGKGDNVRIKSIDSEYRFCELKNGTYKVTFKQSYGNSNPYGECGGFRSMAAEISEPPWYAVKEPDIYEDEKGQMIMKMRGFMDSCGSESPFLTKSVVFESQIEKVTITQVNELSMYRPLPAE